MFAAAWAEGKGLTMELAIVEALAEAQEGTGGEHATA
jgi:hypothetical protein